MPASPASFREAVKSDVPTLLFSGERDPVTPKRDADLAAETLPHSRHFVIPDGAHGMGGLSGLECLHDLLVSFVETAKPDDFYGRLTELVAAGECGTVDEVTSPDDNLQAVFKYLVKT